MERPRRGAIGVVERHTSGASKTEQHYPATAIGILERAAETCKTLDFFQATKELSVRLFESYPDFVAIFKDGIKRHGQIAKQQNLPWKGRITGEVYDDNQEAPSYGGEEHVIIDADCIKLHSSIRYGNNTDEVRIVGSPDGKNVTSVRFTQTKMNEGANKTGKKIVRHIQVNFRNGVPTELSIPPGKKSSPQK